jgi:hypothetical protein
MSGEEGVVFFGFWQRRSSLSSRFFFYCLSGR